MALWVEKGKDQNRDSLCGKWERVYLREKVKEIKKERKTRGEEEKLAKEMKLWVMRMILGQCIPAYSHLAVDLIK